MSEIVGRVAKAWNGEWPRWISRDARWLKEGFQVCRYDDSGIAGEFSEVHRFETEREMVEGFERLRNAAAARAAIAAMREPTLAMAEKGTKHLPGDDYTLEDEEREIVSDIYRDMIDAALAS